MAFPDAITSQANVALCSLVTLKITRVILWLGIQLIAYLSLKPANTSCFWFLTRAIVSVSNFKVTPTKVESDDSLKYQLKEPLMVPSISLVWFLWTTWVASDSWTVRIGKGSFQVSWVESVKKKSNIKTKYYSLFFITYLQQNVSTKECACKRFVWTSFLSFFFLKWQATYG